MPPYLEQLEAKVRRAAACRQYEETVRLSAEFADAVRTYAHAFPKGDVRAREAMRKHLDVLSWTLAVMRGARSACAAELQKVSTVNRYSRRAVEPLGAAGIQLEA